MKTEIIIALIGILSNIITGFLSWFLTRKKYNTEVDSGLIKNMKESLEFYKTLSNDNKERLEEVLKRNEKQEKELAELRGQVLSLLGNLCMDLSCQLRKRDLNLFNNGIKVSKKNQE